MGMPFQAEAVSLLPESYREEGLRIIKETNETLSAYIQGQALVCIFVGAFTFIGYLIIDWPYSFVCRNYCSILQTSFLTQDSLIGVRHPLCYCRFVRISLMQVIVRTIIVANRKATV